MVELTGQQAMNLAAEVAEFAHAHGTRLQDVSVEIADVHPVEEVRLQCCHDEVDNECPIDIVSLVNHMSVCKHDYTRSVHCGVNVCAECDHHEGLARCYCGWAVDDGDGKRQLVEMGENIKED